MTIHVEKVLNTQNIQNFYNVTYYTHFVKECYGFSLYIPGSSTE